MSLWLAENPIDSQHVVKDFIEQDQRHIQFFFVEYLVKMGKFLLKPFSSAAEHGLTSTFWDVLFIVHRTQHCGDRGSTVVKVQYYKSEGRWFDPSWCQWIFH